MLRLVYLFFFFSGFSALIYEVSWVRELSLTLGNTVQATSTVLAVFMGGIAIGAYAGGRLVDKFKTNALSTYGYLEISVGIISLLANQLLQSSSGIYVWLYHALANAPEGLLFVRLAIATAVLLIPTILMGATLPILVRFLAQLNISGKLFSILYGVNTLGASLGSFFACFVGFSYLGLQATFDCAVIINLSIGALSVMLGRSKGMLSFQHAAADSNTAQEDYKDKGKKQWFFLCTMSFLIGFTALSYEVLWTRILRSHLTSLTYVFSIMITMFLLGLATGSFVINRPIMQKALRVRPFLIFGLVQYVATLAAASSLFLLDYSGIIYTFLQEYLLIPLGLSTASLLNHLIFMFVVSTVSVFVPTIFIGMLFPLVGTLAASKQNSAASSVGVVYAVNTIGCVCGTLTCGLVLMQTIGSYAALEWTVRLSLLTGLIACAFAEQIPTAIRLALLILPVPLVLLFHPVHVLYGRGPGSTVLGSAEDSTGFMQIVSIPADDDVQMIMNGGCLAGSSPICRRYMRLMGHLPVLLNKHPDDVLVGCFGTGTTCGAVAIHPEVKSVDLVELSPMVLKASSFFRDTNCNVLANPKVKVHLNDVRNYLLSTDKKFDVITFEPPPPTEAGVVNLYSEQFYRTIADRLKKDGLLCQWVPMHQVSSSLWKMMVATARQVFPYVGVWLPNNREAIFIASFQPVSINITEIQKRIDATAELKRNMDDVGLGNVSSLLSTYLVSDKLLDNYIGDAMSITDDRPRLEFFIPFYGPLTNELDVEAAGKADLDQLVKILPADFKQKFWKDWQAIHLLREAGQSQANKASALIDEAFKLNPESKWLQYVNAHRQNFHKPADDTWIHGP